MWIEIGAELFETNDTKGLHFLLNLLTWNPTNSLSRYNVYVDSRNILNFDNYKSLSYDDKKILDDEFDAYVTTNAKSKYKISNKEIGLNSFNLEEAIRFFIQPTSIILENNKNDSAFIKALIYHFDNKDANGFQPLVEYINNGWIQFENAGGCTNVENFIEAKLQSFNNLAVKNNINPHKYIRCMVILDSDKEFSTQGQKPAYTKLENYLKSKNIINYHFLEKRMMENYMPDEVINFIVDNNTKSWVNVYRILTEEQKDYLSYKSGFSKEIDDKGNRKPLKDEIITLYNNISKTNFQILDKGLNYSSFKDRFPELFYNNIFVNKFTLKKRANSDELERIIEKIKQLL